MPAKLRGNVSEAPKVEGGEGVVLLPDVTLENDFRQVTHGKLDRVSAKMDELVEANGELANANAEIMKMMRDAQLKKKGMFF